MKSKLLIPIVVAVVALAGGAYFLTSSKDEDSKTTNSSSTDTAQPSKDAEQNEHSGADHLSMLKKQTIGEQPDCSLYTFEELGKIWGVTFTDTDEDGSKVKEINGPNTKLYECDYNETDSGQGVSYVIQYKEYADEEGAKTEMKNVRDGAKLGDKVYFIHEEKSGVGDEAFFSNPTGTGALSDSNQQMYIRSHNVVFLLSGVNLAGVDDSYKEKLVASYKLHFE